MPTYEYHCDKCEHHFEEFKGLTEPHPAKCPSCKVKYGDKFHQVYHAGIAIVYGNPTTFGQQAEINERRLGKEQMAIKAEMALPENRKAKSLKMPKGAKRINKAGAKLPWWRSGDVPKLSKMAKPLDLKNVPNVQKYIESGDK